MLQNIKVCSTSWQEGLGQQLYFVRCMTEYVDVTASECTKSSGAREVTLTQMSFAKCEIWIALLGDGVTFAEAN
jgi:hypothetical protein